jgi:YidC/Oxa1 family membrane protein insertase
MNFDRNTVIGFVILGVLFFGFFYFNNKQQMAYQKEKARQDSILNANKPKPSPTAIRQDSLRADSFNKVTNSGDFQTAVNGTEQLIPVNNGLITVTFTNKGGQVKSVELNKFKGVGTQNVMLNASGFDKISYNIATAAGKTADITDFYFSGGQPVKNADGSTTVAFELKAADGRSLTHTFVIHPNNYLIDFNIGINGANQLLSNNTLNLLWQDKAVRQQKDLSLERTNSQIAYKVGGDYDFSNALRGSSVDFNKPVNWVSVKQQFFTTVLIDKNNFNSGSVIWSTPTDSETIIQATANLKVQLPYSNNVSVPLAVYYGPTDYKTLKQYGLGLENQVNLGSGMFAFVKYINRWIVIPVFDLFMKITSNFGIVILLLTLFIRLLISPLTYSSYLSGAKMKVLRPEIEKLKAKYGSDQQQMSMEQMRLFREAGVNPMGGCIPGLLQVPIFFALYNFFNSNVALRGQSFLWAHDLSQPDSILNFGFSVPLLGDHLSLFTLTAIITSFLISLYSMSMTPDQGNPVLKYMPYFFPIILLFVFNKLPAGLTWYYTVSNMITLSLQFVIQTYIIDHDRILAKMEENRKKPKTRPKWQERFEQMQEQQRKLQDMQNKKK